MTPTPATAHLPAPRVAIVGGAEYAAVHAIRSALSSLPPAATLLLTSTFGVSRIAAALAAAAAPPIPTSTFLWKQNVAQLLPRIDLALLFYDGATDGYRYGGNGIPRLIRRLTLAAIPFRLYLPTGTLAENPLEFFSLACSPDRAEDSHRGHGNTQRITGGGGDVIGSDGRNASLASR